MLTDLLLESLRPLVGVREDNTSPIQPMQEDPLDDLLKPTTGVTLDQCHDLLQTATICACTKFPDTFVKYLRSTRDDAIRNLLSTLQTRLAEVGLASRLLNPTTLFKGIPTAPMAITKSGRQVGFWMEPIQRDVTINIDRLLFTGAFADGFSLKLTCIETGIESSITPTANNWKASGLQLRAGYSYYLTYLEADLGEGNQAKNTITSWPVPTKGCKGCAAGCLCTYIRIKSIVLTDGVVTETKDTNYGLNLVFSADGDLSGRFVDNPLRLLPVLREQMAMTFLHKIAYSTRKNPDTEDARQGALFALTDTDNANRVPILFASAMKSLVKTMQDEASKAIDVNSDDEISWRSV